MSDPVTLAFQCCKPGKDFNPDLSPIILHHGFMNSKERWIPIQQNLANETGRVVYAVDARNHGESERSEIFNFNLLPNDLKHFMDAHSISKACLVGHSMGGLAVMMLALSSPDRVEALIVEDASPKEPEPELYHVFAALVREQLECFKKSTNADTEGSMQQKLRECLYRNIPMIPDEDQEIISNMEFQIKRTENGFESKADLNSFFKAILHKPICCFPEDGQFKKDALFIYGCKSNFAVIEDKDLILKYFPKAKFCGFENAGHEVCLRDPKRFVAEVKSFL
ncbi:hypothetical protein TNIN_338661 [Trichonephila inaurata madagascariensis]|uniref:sn-1-specific diacylglycerol lipase ABHD11 n=1 Tax=Trichonephila inaurata madagascariensis TaxID=2747483 RepID=A0A8X7BYJ0_9ARAC|nr:hypothetical protein TNIN_338661 [Trichonephila inaurata madagascariensis]